MPIIFEKTASRLAAEKAGMLVIALLVGAAFASIFYFVDDDKLVWPVMLAAGVAILISVIMALKIIKEIIAVLQSGEPWKVIITNDILSWHSPIPDQMESFELKLSEISSVRQQVIRYKNSKRTPKTSFHIFQTNGKKLELKAQLCGINPHKVFKALESKNIEFQFVDEWKGSKLRYEVAG